MPSHYTPRPATIAILLVMNEALKRTRTEPVFGLDMDVIDSRCVLL